MKQFRIMPAQHCELQKQTGTRYGFHIANHPLGDKKLGFYVASWDTREKAEAAAYCLGYPPVVVYPIGFYLPGKSTGWRKRR